MSDDILVIADKNGNPIAGVRDTSRRAQLRDHTRSILAERMSFTGYGTAYRGHRNYFEILGYNQYPSVDDFKQRFDRDALAGKVVECPPDDTWRDTPTVKDGEDKDATDDTAFAKAWSDFANKMQVYSKCKRVDTLSGIGRYGVLHIGVAGDTDLTKEVTHVNSVDDILYMQAYSEQAVRIYEWQTNPSDPRFGKPHLYRINVGHMQAEGVNPLEVRNLIVHHSRIIHVAEGLLENEVFGRPRLQRVINYLDDAMKVVGGSAEATWLLMRKGFVLDADPLADEWDDEARANLDSQFDEYEHGLRRFMFTKGLKTTDLGSEVADPSGIFDILATMISIATHMPKRILLGSERGQLASSQDEKNWAGFIASRQLNFAEPNILRPIVDTLVKWGAIPPPSTGQYTVLWDPLFEMSDTEKTQNMNVAAQGYAAASNMYGHPVVSVEEFRGEHTPFPEQLPPELQQIIDQKKLDAQAMRDRMANGAQNPQNGDPSAQNAQNAQNGGNQQDVLQQVGNLDAVKAMMRTNGYSEGHIDTLIHAFRAAAKEIDGNRTLIEKQ